MKKKKLQQQQALKEKSKKMEKMKVKCATNVKFIVFWAGKFVGKGCK
jgi:hypothetical protein